MIKDKIILVEGDITEEGVEAIVNAANTDLVLGAGVAGAILKKAGAQIQAECEKLAPVELGQAVATRAGGKLPCKYVIHAAAMRLGGQVKSDALHSATLNTLKLADKKKIKSIAFPAIGTGIGGYHLASCAKDMLTVVFNYLRDMEHQTSLQEVRFVLYDKDSFNAFKKQYDLLPEDVAVKSGKA
ncbi:MAG TPA: macro domain-containing protein [Planctomycetota bacterium]|nr:macro domain-containing protein [Planctomycetota bacterium]